ncbi:MAG TPA: TIGR01777 family oxidoreductase [Phycisphaerales bacterium]|nr:TIGR01777 family oxidoreductase [Phycisphaerales bacterium]
MRIFITGATGLIGRRFVLDRLERGDQVVLLSRDAAQARRLFAADANRNITVIAGNVAAPGPWQSSVAGCDAVVHLAGAGLADHRWTRSYKQTIVSSRVDSTHQIVSAMEMATASQGSVRRPRILLNASAVGYYGNTGDREIDETAPPGTSSDFLANLCVQWEKQAAQARALGARVVLLRTGIVLDERGGALPSLMRPFSFLAGGPLGNGKQWMPWIHWRDLIGIIDLALEEGDLDGPINAVSPNPVRARDMARAIARIMGKPSWLPMPRIALRALLGEFGNYLTVGSKGLPRAAQKRGYVFLYQELPRALAALLLRDETSEPTEPVAVSVSSGVMRMNSGPAPLTAVGPLALMTEERRLPQKPIKLLAIDVDGTLLRSDASLPQGVIQACRSAERAGCVVILATARAPRGTRTVLQTLDITSPVINYNGAVIWNPIDDKPQYHEPLSGEIARQIVEAARALYPEVMVAIEALDHWCTDRVDGRWASADGKPAQPDFLGDLDEALSRPVTKLNLMGEPDLLKPVLEMVTERFWKPKQVAVFLSDPSLIQITHPMVDKAIALQRIARKMNIQREEVMAIGDASNDMGMIEWAGFGVAVANAYPMVREMADAVVPSNDELGVARAIQRFVLAKR